MSDQRESGRRIDRLYYWSLWLPFAILGIVFAIGITETVMTGNSSFMQNGLTMIVLGLGAAALMGLHAVLFANRFVRENDVASRKQLARFPFLRFVPGLVRKEPIEVQVWMLRAIGVGAILVGIYLSVLGLLRL
jgi:hypothetical protein